MEKAKIKYAVDAGLAISFILCALTGIIKFPLWTRDLRFVYKILPGLWMTRIHDLSGMIMAALVLVHLALNWSWIKAMTKSIFGRKKKR